MNHIRLQSEHSRDAQTGSWNISQVLKVLCCLCVPGLFNLRGLDIPYHPFFYSYTLLTTDEVWSVVFFWHGAIFIPDLISSPLWPSPRLFIHPQRATGDLRKYLNASCDGPLCVKIKDYDSVLEELKTYVARPDIKLWLGTEYTNYAVYEIIKPLVRMQYCVL